MMSQQSSTGGDILRTYCSQLDLQLPEDLRITQWIEERLRNVQIDHGCHDQQAASFKAELLDQLNVIFYNNVAISKLLNHFQQISPLNLYHEMVRNVRYRQQQQKIDYELQQLEQYALSIDRQLHSVFFANGTLNESLVVDALQLAEALRGKVLLFLNRWKTSQVTGTSHVVGLDIIQPWVESLFGQNWSILLSMDMLGKTFPSVSLTNLRRQGMNLAINLLNDGCLVEKQPPQVMRTRTHYQVTVRHLVGEWLYDKVKDAQANVCIVSESQAQTAQQIGVIPPERSSGHLGYERAAFTYDGQTRILSAEFRNLQIKSIIRPNRRGQDCVLDDKFGLLFYFTAQSGDFSFVPWTLSLPIVVIVHCNQETQAWATIAWDNASFDVGRAPFNVPDSMPWKQMADTLSRKFVAVTERALTKENLHFLCEKAVRREVPYPVPREQTISWSHFCKDLLPDRPFTFWEWFNMAMKVTKEHLKGPWTDGNVFGFISKSRVDAYLQGCADGTFLLRFSDSLLGGITIAYVMAGKDGRPSKIRHVQPFTAKEMANHPLANSINDLNELRFVFPDVPKQLAFGRYMNPPLATKKFDYVSKKTKLIIEDPTDEDNEDVGACSSTTNGYGGNQQSPAASTSWASTPSPDSTAESSSDLEELLRSHSLADFSPRSVDDINQRTQTNETIPSGFDAMRLIHLVVIPTP